MCVVHEAVEDGVGDGRVGDQLVPVLDGELAGHDRRASPVAVITRLDAPFLVSLSELAGKTVAVPEAHVTTDYLRKLPIPGMIPDSGRRRQSERKSLRR